MIGPYEYCSFLNQGIFVNYLLVEKVAKFEEFIECLLVRDIFLDSVKECQVVRE